MIKKILNQFKTKQENELLLLKKYIELLNQEINESKKLLNYKLPSKCRFVKQQILTLEIQEILKTTSYNKKK